MLWHIILHALRIPYNQAAADGFWGAKTATLNFCEEDYIISHYCAELCNTLTNLLYLSLGIKGICNCIKYSHSTVFLVAFIGYVAVGVGSVLFHATLKYPMQLIDELSMIYTTCLMCFASISFQKSLPFRFLAGTFLVALAIFITVYYHLTQDPVFHQTAYALLTIGVLVHSMWVMENTLRPQLSGHGRFPRMPDDGRRLLRDMWLLVSFGITVFLAGFVIWNLDNIYCDSIRRWRRGIGLPWAILLEGHGWWHLLTGIGAYIYIVWGIWLRRCLEDKSSDFNLHWPNIFTSVPEVKATRCFKDMKRE